MAWDTTATIITIVVGGTLVTVLVVIALWLYCRRRKRLAAPSSSHVRYSKLQKRNRSKSPNTNAKHVSLTMTTTSSSSRRSSVSVNIPQMTQQPTLPLYITPSAQACQQQSQTEHRSHASTLQRNPSATSQYSFRPEHLSKGAFETTLTVPQPLFSRPAVSSNLAGRPSIPERRASASDLNRATSTRIANYHTDAEYSDLIGQDLVELLGCEPFPPPSIPRKSSRRESRPDREGGAPGRLISEEVQGWEKAPMLEFDPANSPQSASGRFRVDSRYADRSVT